MTRVCVFDITCSTLNFCLTPLPAFNLPLTGNVPATEGNDDRDLSVVPICRPPYLPEGKIFGFLVSVRTKASNQPFTEC